MADFLGGLRTVGVVGRVLLCPLVLSELSPPLEAFLASPAPSLLIALVHWADS